MPSRSMMREAVAIAPKRVASNPHRLSRVRGPSGHSVASLAQLSAGAEAAITLKCVCRGSYCHTLSACPFKKEKAFGTTFGTAFALVAIGARNFVVHAGRRDAWALPRFGVRL